MKIGLLSDSHGNIQYVKKAAEYLKKANVSLIVHLGDDCEDLDAVKNLGVEVVKVPGVFSSCYQDQSIPNRVIKEIEGVKILITHSSQPHPNDLPEDKDPKDIIEQENIKAVFYGHTHIPKIENKNGILWINPGHLRESDKKGNPATFAIVEIKDGMASGKIIKYSDVIHND
jgi:putative phosphoesterase